MFRSADDVSDDCMICNQPFTTYSRRRHHCRACGDLVCAACSPGHAMMIVNNGAGSKDVRKSMRVCQLCEAKTRRINPRKTPKSPTVKAPSRPDKQIQATQADKKKKKNRLFYKTEAVITSLSINE